MIRGDYNRTGGTHRTVRGFGSYHHYYHHYLFTHATPRSASARLNVCVRQTTQWIKSRPQHRELRALLLHIAWYAGATLV